MYYLQGQTMETIARHTETARRPTPPKILRRIRMSLLPVMRRVNRTRGLIPTTMVTSEGRS